MSKNSFAILVEKNEPCEINVADDLAAKFLFTEEKVVQDLMKPTGHKDKIVTITKMSLETIRSQPLNFDSKCITYPNGITVCTKGGLISHF